MPQCGRWWAVVDKTAVLLALRNRALTLSVAATGSTTLAATTTGYTRSSGSFITDDFQVGQEVTPAGFATNTVRVITRVEALTLTVDTVGGALTAESAAGSRSLTVTLPAIRGWDNVTVTPVAGRPYLEEDFVPGTSELISIPYNGGAMEETGLYVLKWYGLANKGSAGIRKCVDDLMLLFAPGTSLTAGSDVVWIRDDIGPATSQIVPQGTDRAVCALTIPWRAYTTNLIAA